MAEQELKEKLESIEKRLKDFEDASVIVRSEHGYIARVDYKSLQEMVKLYNVINYDGVVSNCFVCDLDKKERLLRLDDISEGKTFTIEIDKEADNAKFEIKEKF